MTNGVLEPRGLVPPGPRLRAWALAALYIAVGAVAFEAVRRIDVPAMRVRDAFIQPNPAGILLQVLTSLRSFGQFLTPLTAIVLIAAYDRRRRVIICALIAAEAVTWCAYQAPKLVVARYRPRIAAARIAPLDQLNESSTWVAGPNRLNTDEDYRSFPSGHTASVMATAIVLAWFYRRTAWLFWLLAAGCGLSRVLEAEHWPSDVLAGGWIGFGSGWLVLRPYLVGLPRRWSVST